MNKTIAFLLLIILNFGVNAKLVTLNNCVLDDKSQLLWEVKSSNKGLQNAHNTYTWFNGKTGVENGDYSQHCNFIKNCNTQAFINALNQQQLCQKNTWRLPSDAELKTLLRYGDNEPLIDTQYFPNTRAQFYWTAEDLDKNIAIDVPFFYGGSQGSDKSFDAHIRAVSDAQ